MLFAASFVPTVLSFGQLNYFGHPAPLLVLEQACLVPLKGCAFALLVPLLRTPFPEIFAWLSP